MKAQPLGRTTDSAGQGAAEDALMSVDALILLNLGLAFAIVLLICALLTVPLTLDRKDDETRHAA